MKDLDDSFQDVMGRLRVGDEAAAGDVYGRFVGRLIGHAARQFDAGLRARADHEDVVQSVFKSFFARYERGLFDLGGWDGLWALLAAITVRKCRERRDYLRAGRRNAAREVQSPEPPEGLEPWAGMVDREPTPAEAAMLAETVGRWLSGLDPTERTILELGLQASSDREVAERLNRSERTVRRVRLRAEERLRHQLAAGDGRP